MDTQPYPRPNRVFLAGETCATSNLPLFKDISSPQSKTHPNSSYKWCGTPSCKCFAWDNPEWNTKKRQYNSAGAYPSKVSAAVSFGPPMTTISTPGPFVPPDARIVQMEERLQHVERAKAGADSRFDSLENKLLAATNAINELKGRITSLEVKTSPL